MSNGSFPVHIPRGTVIMIGVQGEHDSEEAEDILISLLGTIMARPDMPLMLQHSASDCLVSPVERGSRHFEVKWLQV